MGGGALVAREDAQRSNQREQCVLPDLVERDDYFIADDTCRHCKCRTLNTNAQFGILRRNMCSAGKPAIVSCDGHGGGGTVYNGDPSYIYSVKWADFCVDVNKHLEIAEALGANAAGYVRSKEV